MSFLSVSALHSQPQHGSFVLMNISFTQERFQKIAIIGETGAGKTTLMKIIAGLMQPASGEIFFEDEKVLGPDWQLIPGQKKIAYLSQHFELRNNYRMEELLQYANELPEQDAQKLFSICRIDHLMKRKSGELSGGEKQRIALARLLISSPRLLILDEPFSNLDLIHKKILKDVVSDISDRLKITLIIASHDPDDILPWADDVLVLQNGRLIQQGTPTAVYQNPVNEYTAALCGDYNLVNDADAVKLVPLNIKHQCGGKLFIRPQDLLITDNKTNTVKARVVSSSFFGIYYEIKVDVGGLKLSLYNNRELKADEVVFIKALSASDKNS